MKLTGIDQLWAAHITYVRQRAEFVHLAVILESPDHKISKWYGASVEAGLIERPTPAMVGGVVL